MEGEKNIRSMCLVLTVSATAKQASRVLVKRDRSVHGNQPSWNVARCICHGYCFVYFSWVVLSIFSQDQLWPPRPAVSYGPALLTFSFVGSIYCCPNWPGYWVIEDSGTGGEMDAAPKDIEFFLPRCKYWQTLMLYDHRWSDQSCVVVHVCVLYITS